jgi:hypothetical protein
MPHLLQRQHWIAQRHIVRDKGRVPHLAMAYGFPLRAAVTARAGLPLAGPVPERSLNAPLQAPAAARTRNPPSLRPNINDDRPIIMPVKTEFTN